jgi:hypothetical protein
VVCNRPDAYRSIVCNRPDACAQRSTIWSVLTLGKYEEEEEEDEDERRTRRTKEKRYPYFPVRSSLQPLDHRNHANYAIHPGFVGQEPGEHPGPPFLHVPFPINSLSLARSSPSLSLTISFMFWERKSSLVNPISGTPNCSTRDRRVRPI